MNNKRAKELRKQRKNLRRDETDIMRDGIAAFYNRTMNSPLRVRIRIAWAIIRGARHGKK